MIHYYNKNEPYIFYYPYCPSKNSVDAENRIVKCKKYRFLKEGSNNNYISKVLNRKDMKKMVSESNTDLVMQFDGQEGSVKYGYYTLNCPYEKEQAKETVGWPKIPVRVKTSDKKMKSVAGGDEVTTNQLPKYIEHKGQSLDNILKKDWEPPDSEKDWTNGGLGKDNCKSVPLTRGKNFMVNMVIVYQIIHLLKGIRVGG